MASAKLFGPTPITLIRTPILPAQIITFESGLEQRNRVWSNPRFKFELRWKLLDDTDTRSVMNFFMERGGNFESFLFQDPTAPNGSGQVLGLGTGSRTLFKIYGNRIASAAALLDGVDITATSIAGVTVSLGNGTVTFATAPTSGQVVTSNVQSERYVVRFEQGQWNHEYFVWLLVREATVTLLQDKGLP